MKKIIFAIMLCASFMGRAQEISTTEEEYNYLTEGIRDQVLKGLDQKKDGYTLDKFYEAKSMSSDAVFHFYKFIDSANNIKAIGIIHKTPNSKITSGHYMCYPINNEKLYKKFWKKVSDNMMEKTIYKATADAMIHLFKQ